MTLLVNTYFRADASAKTDILEVERSKELAGFEVCRRSLWGTPIMESLGLRLLPTLRDMDVYAEGQDLNILQHEAELILANLELIAKQTSYPEDFIKWRTNNIVDAVKRAKATTNGIGGVVIW